MKQGRRPSILTHALSTAFCGLFIEFKTDQIINVTIFMSGCGLNGTVSKCRRNVLNWLCIVRDSRPKKEKAWTQLKRRHYLLFQIT